MFLLSAHTGSFLIMKTPSSRLPKYFYRTEIEISALFLTFFLKSASSAVSQGRHIQKEPEFGIQAPPPRERKELGRSR
jgi:hypothetical protein